MITVPIAAEPDVTTNPNSNSPSAVPGELSAKIGSCRPKGFTTSRPPASSAATAIPAAR